IVSVVVRVICMGIWHVPRRMNIDVQIYCSQQRANGGGIRLREMTGWCSLWETSWLLGAVVGVLH
ncbi:MAG: hypothetical protein KDB23_29100, partial [Planctomycetales bacterium]|nr:hypothetical protein [Planctomycetales bacterium]